MYITIVSELAHEDPDRIILYIAKNLASPIAATKFLDKIEECYDNLKRNPLMYEKCHYLCILASVLHNMI